MVDNSDKADASESRLLQKLYRWTISWASRPEGHYALFAVAFAESSFFPIPPDVLLIALCLGAPRKSFRFALICLVGSIVGGMAGYGIGQWAYELLGRPIVEFYHAQAVMDRIQDWYHTYGLWGILAAAITPIPYKVFTIASGLFGYPFWWFVLASAFGRGLRFFCVAGLIWLFGPTAQRFIERYLNLLAWLCLALLLLGFLALKWIKF